jgi:hypothetical protein
VAAEPVRAVEGAIQNLMAARLGRAFVPLALAFVLGFVRVLLSPPADVWVPIGAALSVLATLGYGLRVVQRALSRPSRAWMTLAQLGSLIPLGYALYLLGWEGLRLLSFSSLPQFAIATLHTVLGVWVLRSWMKVVEIERLAQIMLMNSQDGGTT